MKPTICLIWAEANNHVIGYQNSIPWHLPEDLKRFKDLTTGHPIIMGARTWESLPKKPLPGRKNIVVSRNPCYMALNAIVETSLEFALEDCKDSNKVFIIGGSSLYKKAISIADELYITYLDISVEGDTYAPTIGPEWEITDHEEHTSSNGLFYVFNRLIRKW